MKNKNLLNNSGYLMIQDKFRLLPIDNLNEMAVFSLIYGFSQDGESYFIGSYDYIAKKIMTTRRTAINILNKLIEKNLIIKKSNKTDKNGYRINLDYINQIFNEICEGSETIAPNGVKQFHQRSETISPTTSSNTSNNTNTIQKNQNSISNDNSISKIDTITDKQTVTTLNNLEEKNIDSKAKKLFKNSKFSNVKELAKAFKKMDKKDLEKYGGAYLPYYIEAVMDWSDAKNVKRTDRGWFATIKQFMRSDKQKNNFMTKSRYESIFGKKIDYSNSGLL